jgi:CRISPR-associated endonuclease Csn1
MCIYTGLPISQSQLFSVEGGIDIDHILPRSRTLDDSQANKVLCFRQANAEKGNRTPYEWLAQKDPDRYEALTGRVLSLLKSNGYAFPKYQKFLLKELKLDDFVKRQLVDTAYITVATTEYLRCMFDADHHVLGLKGRLTSELRWRWGLETLLEEIPDSPAWAEAAKLRPGEKNRADHRHHAIDALVIALTDRPTLQRLSAALGDRYAAREEAQFEPPWKGFRQQVKEKVASILVSHRVERKVSGQLHEETLYGPTGKQGEWVVRKPVESLSLAEIPRIRDVAIREMVTRRLVEGGIEPGRGKEKDVKRVKELLSNLKMPSGVPIKKVRVLKNEETIRPIRSGESTSYVKPGSTHHLCIFEWEEKGKKKRDAVFVSMLEATYRVKTGLPVIDRIPPDDHPTIPKDARFVMSLSSRELVYAKTKLGECLMIFRTAASTSRQMWFSMHSDARKSNDIRDLSFKPNSFQAAKVTIDLLGRMRWAND